MAEGEYTGVIENRKYAPSKLATQASEQDVAFCVGQIRRAGRYLEQGHIKAATDSLRRGLERVPEHPECLSYLAVCIAAGQRKYVTAENLVKKILAENPYDATAWYALGRINLLGGRREKAFANFARAKSVSREDAEVSAIVEQMDPRQKPVLPWLPRGHFLNILLGRLRARLGR